VGICLVNRRSLISDRIRHVRYGKLTFWKRPAGVALVARPIGSIGFLWTLASIVTVLIVPIVPMVSAAPAYPGTGHPTATGSPVTPSTGSPAASPSAVSSNAKPAKPTAPTTQPATQPATQSAIIDAKVVQAPQDQNVAGSIVGLSAGSRSGVAVGDLFWVLSKPDSEQDNKQSIEQSTIVGHGEIFVVTEDRSAGRLYVSQTNSASSANSALTSASPSIPTSQPAEIVSDQTVVILHRESLSALRDHLPTGATIHGKIARVAPGRLTAWIDVNANAGLRMGDSLLITRKGVPLSRGRIGVLNWDAALTTLEPLVGNALPEPGDSVELWPAPADARWGRVATTILKVVDTPNAPGQGAQISIAGSVAEGITVDRLVDVYRGRKYLGTARIVEVSGPNSIAEMVVSASRMREAPRRQQPELWPVEGDRAIVRAPGGDVGGNTNVVNTPPGPLLVAVFQITGGYCLLATGEPDGVKEGETFLVRRQDPDDPAIWHDVAQLTIKKVEVDHAGAQIKPLTSQVAPLRVWDMAERQVPGIEPWRTVGIIESVDAASRTAIVAANPGSSVAVGEVVGCIPAGDAAASGTIVIYKDSDRLILYAPQGWADDITSLLQARVDAPQAAKR